MIHLVLFLGLLPGWSTLPDCVTDKSAPCLVYQRCDWDGVDWRGKGHCWKVTRDHPGIRFNEITVICDDKSGEPRTCQQEFDKQSEEEKIMDCLDRRRQSYSRKCTPNCPNGCMYSEEQEKNCILEMARIDQMSGRESCSVPKEAK